MTISEDQKEKFKKIRDEYHKKRDDLSSQKIGIEVRINGLKSTIKKLDKEINENRPRFEGEDNGMICKPCDTYSMKYLTTTPNPDKQVWYKCIICGHEDFHT